METMCVTCARRDDDALRAVTSIRQRTPTAAGTATTGAVIGSDSPPTAWINRPSTDGPAETTATTPDGRPPAAPRWSWPNPPRQRYSRDGKPGAAEAQRLCARRCSRLTIKPGRALETLPGHGYRPITVWARVVIDCTGFAVCAAPL